jgi:hypothetical protein
MCAHERTGQKVKLAWEKPYRVAQHEKITLHLTNFAVAVQVLTQLAQHGCVGTEVRARGKDQRLIVHLQ